MGAQVKVYVLENTMDYYGPYFHSVAATLDDAQREADRVGPLHPVEGTQREWRYHQARGDGARAWEAADGRWHITEVDLLGFDHSPREDHAQTSA